MGVSKVEPERSGAAARIFALGEGMNQAVLQHLAPAAWQAKAPGGVRTIAAIFTHMHNVRCKWVRLSAPHLGVPALLQRAHCTPEQARVGLRESGARCGEMLAGAPGGEGVARFRRDGWAASWPVGPEMLCYMVAHEAHHRGQVLMLAHQLGFPVAKEVGDRMWNWEKLFRE